MVVRHPEAPPRPGPLQPDRAVVSLQGEGSIRKVVPTASISLPFRAPLPPLCRSLMDSTRCRRTSCTWLGASVPLFLWFCIGNTVSTGAVGQLEQASPYFVGKLRLQGLGTYRNCTYAFGSKFPMISGMSLSLGPGFQRLSLCIGALDVLPWSHLGISPPCLFISPGLYSALTDSDSASLSEALLFALNSTAGVHFFS